MKEWLEAFRLRTLFLSLACIMMGNFLAAINLQEDYTISALAILTAIFLQILSNLANDYGDSIHGADNAGRKGPQRQVQSGKISSLQMKAAIKVLIILSLLSGIILLIFASKNIGLLGSAIIFAVGVAAIIAAIAYTNGKKPYGYSGFGDISVFIFFGIVAVLGTLYLHLGTFDLLALLPATSCGMFAVAVLNINNMRDIESDSLAGKNSIPVQIGFDTAKIYHTMLIGIACCASLIYVFLLHGALENYLFVLAYPLFLYSVIKVLYSNRNSKIDYLLGLISGGTFLFVVLFRIGFLF